MKRGMSAPIGRSEKMNVAVQRPTVNLKEAENVAEQATAAAREDQPEVRFSKHGTFGPPVNHTIESMWKD